MTRSQYFLGQCLWQPSILWETKVIASDFSERFDQMLFPPRVNKSAASKHLSLLKSVGVIEMDRDGTQVNCTLVMTCVLEMMHCAKQGKDSTAKLEKNTPNPPNESISIANPNTSCCTPKKEEI